MADGTSDPLPQVETLVTAAAAYPRLEQLFLDANSHVEMGFRLFDPRTSLRSDAAKSIGRNWADLFVHTLNRGIQINLTVSDFDPVMAVEMHSQAWEFVAICNGINELTRQGAAKITVRCMQHPAQGGIVPRLLFAAKTRRMLRSAVKLINEAHDPAKRLDGLPGLKTLVQMTNGKTRMRPFALPRLFPVTLHHKMAVFDAEATYIGGLDLNERRYDDADHNQPAQDTWHDVQLVLHDPVVAADALTYLRTLPEVIGRKTALPKFTSPFVTTLSRARRHNTFHLSPQTISSTILKAHLTQIRRARTFIYLETQYFRDRRIAKALARAGKRHRGLKLIILLPAAPEDVAFQSSAGLDGRFGEYLQARAIRQVRRAFGARFLAISPAQPRQADMEDANTDRATLHGAPIVYVHAKVSIFDDHAAIVSSANLNGRSMKWDTEAGVVITTPEQVQNIRQTICSHWINQPATSAFLNPQTAFEAWKSLAINNAATTPDQRTGFILPYAVGPSTKAGMPIPGAPEEMV